MILFTLGCEKEVTPQAGEALKAIPATFSEQTTDFALDFWKKVNVQEKAETNYFVSPLSLHIALGMLLNGADGKTKDEIQQTLRMSGNLADINAIYKTLIENLPNADPNVTNKIANSVWYKKDFTIEKTYLDNLAQSFKATISGEDFTSPATVSKINTWASDNTNAKITKVIDKIEPDQVMFLLNALYFKGDWSTPFDVKNTNDQNFAGLSGNKSVKMMNITEKVKYAQRADYQAIELPYANGNYFMTILLPSKTKSLADLINATNSSEWKNLSTALTQQQVIIGLPKFTMQYEINLNKVLAQMGMPTVFTDAADLSKISPPAGKLKVGFVKQNTYVGVDEKGTEAAAVTTIGISLTSVPVYPEFICNRPFAFVISEKSSNTILFVGKVVNP